MAGRTEPDAARTQTDASPPCSPAALAAAGLRADTLIHRGSVVEVWLGSAAGEAAAIKLPTRPLSEDAGAAALLRREYRMLRRLGDPRTPRVLSFADGRGCRALALEYLPGGDLVPLAGAPARHWIGAARDVLGVLAAIHARGYVHGDVKARNVLLDAAGDARLADFGSVQPVGRPLPRGGGTAAHAPRGFALSYAMPAGDVYAFAVLVYELMSGRLPFGVEPGAVPAPPPWPLGAGGEADALAPLAERVVATLTAPSPAAAGTLMDFADVIESVHGRTVGG